MKAVRVQYTVQRDFAEQNKSNIQKVMNAIRANPVPGMQYASFVLADGVTFVHINMASDSDTMDELNKVKEFQDFQAALKASDPISPPDVQPLNLVAAGFDL